MKARTGTGQGTFHAFAAHHASPGRAPHGLRWWEFDITYQTIGLMERLGLAWEVRHARQ